MCSSPPACLTSPLCAPSVRRCRNRSTSFPVAELAAAGVRRISLATSLYRAAMTGFLDAVRQVQDTGRFDFLDGCVTTPELNQMMTI